MFMREITKIEQRRLCLPAAANIAIPATFILGQSGIRLESRRAVRERPG